MEKKKVQTMKINITPSWVAAFGIYESVFRSHGTLTTKKGEEAFSNLMEEVYQLAKAVDKHQAQ